MHKKATGNYRIVGSGNGEHPYLLEYEVEHVFPWKRISWRTHYNGRGGSPEFNSSWINPNIDLFKQEYRAMKEKNMVVETGSAA